MKADPSIKKECSYLSIFDLDNTLVKVNTSFSFGKYLYKQGILSFFTMISLVFLYVRHRFFSLSLEELHEQSFRRLFLGIPLEKVNQWVEGFLSLHFASIGNPPAVGCLKQAQQEGHYTVILSSSPDFLVGPIAELFGVDEWRATSYAVDKNQILSHISELFTGKEKANACMVIIAACKLPRERSAVYSDSYLDLPLLEIAGHPVAVNPDRKLRAVCQKNQWRIL